MRPEEDSSALSLDMLWDYIFVGGGLSASVTSNRLLSQDPSLKILVVEAGPNANNDPSVVYPNSTNLIGGEYDWKYKTVPQVHLDKRQIDVPCGKALGGGTVINSGTQHPFDVRSDAPAHIRRHPDEQEKPKLTHQYRRMEPRR